MVFEKGGHRASHPKDRAGHWQAGESCWETDSAGPAPWPWGRRLSHKGNLTIPSSQGREPKIACYPSSNSAASRKGWQGALGGGGHRHPGRKPWGGHRSGARLLSIFFPDDPRPSEEHPHGPTALTAVGDGKKPGGWTVHLFCIGFTEASGLLNE